MSDNPHIGSTFESFLEEEGMAEEVAAASIKHVLAWQMAKRMHTSCAYLSRFLDAATTRCSSTP